MSDLYSNSVYFFYIKIWKNGNLFGFCRSYQIGFCEIWISYRHIWETNWLVVCLKWVDLSNYWFPRLEMKLLIEVCAFDGWLVIMGNVEDFNFIGVSFRCNGTVSTLWEANYNISINIDRNVMLGIESIRVKWFISNESNQLEAIYN